MKNLVCSSLLLVSMSLAAEPWVINGTNHPTNAETTFFPLLGVLQSQSTTLGTLYINRANTTPFGLFQIGGSFTPTFVPGYIKLDDLYYAATGEIGIRAGQVRLYNMSLSNCRRSNGQPLATTGRGVMYQGPNFENPIGLGGYQRMYFYADATVYAIPTATGDVVCNQSVSPTLTPIVEPTLFKHGFES